nr:fibroin light chain [Pseudoips prasinana]
MLPITLVLLVAACASAAPVVNVALVPGNLVGLPVDNGRAVSSNSIDRAIVSVIDEAGTPLYVVNAKNTVVDLGNVGGRETQALAAAQALGILIKSADGIPGDNCYTAALINAVVSCNEANIRPALDRYIDVTLGGIDHIVQLTLNPRAAKYSRGLAGNCAGGGREFDLDGAWDLIRSEQGNSYNVGILDRLYCDVKRLYQSPANRNNNVAAALTAASLRQVNDIYQRALGPVANFLRSVGTSSVAAAAANAKAAIREAANYCLNSA